MRGSFEHLKGLDPEALGVVGTTSVCTLVIGSGVAGLRAAIEASKVGDVLVLGKAPQESSSTFRAQGGIAVAVDADDSPESHLADTIVAGAGLCDEAVARAMVERGVERVGELVDWGMRFDRKADGTLALGLEAAHSFARVVHSDGDATGRELMRCLVERVKASERVTFAEGWFAVDLILESDEPGSRVVGVLAHHREQGMQVFLAKATVLATGGACDLYRDSSNSGGSTGDGIAMAYRAGASIADMAFVQFHPTALHVEGMGRLLITEAVRGEGGTLLDEAGHRFMLNEHPAGELAPRDVVSRAIAAKIEDAGTGHVYLDVRHVEGFRSRFPGISALLAGVGIDPGRDLIPVSPAAHFTIGGVSADASGRTDLAGLYAIGEVACTGFHGANRLASNSVLEGLVMGAAAAEAVAADDVSQPTRLLGGEVVCVPDGSAGASQSDSESLSMLDALRSLMWENVGILRSPEGMAHAKSVLDEWATEIGITPETHETRETGWQLRNMVLVARLMTESALWRLESRGAHTRLDVTEPAAEYQCHDAWKRGQQRPQRRETMAAITSG